MLTCNEPLGLGMWRLFRNYLRTYVHIFYEGMVKHDRQTQQYSLYSGILFTISNSYFSAEEGHHDVTEGMLDYLGQDM
jgi:hypothetical protein